MASDKTSGAGDDLKSVEEMKAEQEQWEQSMDTYVEESTKPENLKGMINN